MHYKATIIKPVCYWHKAKTDKSMLGIEIDIVLNKNVWEMKGHISVEEDGLFNKAVCKTWLFGKQSI